MRNIWIIFTTDLRHLLTNVIAAIEIVGLILVPPMYAWFTTAGFWDPYSSTGDLQVAVACDDEGYTSSLLPMDINVGNDVLNEIRANKQFDWIITDTHQAIEGVKSGEYYAAIVIPKDFSSRLMTVFSGHAQSAVIDYYSNEKENAIAPRVTSTGATTLEEEIDKAFTQTVTDVALRTTSGFVSFLDGEDVTKYGQTLLSHMDSTLDALSSSASQVDAFAALMGSTASLVNTTAALLGEGADDAREVESVEGAQEAGTAEAESVLTDSEALVSRSMDRGKAAFDELANTIDQALSSLPTGHTDTLGILDTALGNVALLKDAYAALQGDIDKVMPDSSASASMQKAIDDLTTLSADLELAKADLGTLDTKADAGAAAVRQDIEQAKASLDTASASYKETLATSLASLSDTLHGIETTVATLTDQVATTADNAQSATTSLATDLAAAQTSLTDAAQVLHDASGSLQTSRDDLSTALTSGDITKVRSLIGSNPARLSSFISAPTRLEQHTVYGMANNGSAMSPFYTSLSLWIGALFSVVLVNVSVSDTLKQKLKEPKPSELYFGRFGIFAFLSMAQATTVCLGNVFFLGVQCEHLGLYLLAGWVVGIVFSSMVYTLTLSFGSIGKAIAIVLLVMQLGGSGGIFPIQLSSPIFQAIYPWLPFDYSMNMFEGCIAGIYGDQYWVSMAHLGLFFGAALVLGLVLRRPIIRLTNWTLDKLHETKLM